MTSLTPEKRLGVHHDLVDQLGDVICFLEDDPREVQQQLKTTGKSIVSELYEFFAISNSARSDEYK